MNEEVEEESMDEVFGRPGVVLDRIEKADCEELGEFRFKHFPPTVMAAYKSAVKKCNQKRKVGTRPENLRVKRNKIK